VGDYRVVYELLRERRKLWTSNACGIEKMFTGDEKHPCNLIREIYEIRIWYSAEKATNAFIAQVV